MKSFKAASILAAAVFCLCLTANGLGQWPDDPLANMMICDRSGAETIPKIAATSDGGCYVCWYDNTSGNYDVYLQRLDESGQIMWAENGILISDNPQDSWLTDYDMTVDQEDNALIVFNDIRAGGDWDIYAYRISPAGAFLWGDDGLTISDNQGFEADPRVTVTTDGNIVVGWQEENMVHVRKLTPEGEDYWSPAVITPSSTYGMSIARIAPAEDDGVILQALVATGPNYWDPKHLYAYKYDADGQSLWGENGVVVSNAGGFGPQMRPDIVADGAGGVYSYWYDSRNNILHAYAQHILGDGSMAWTANGVLLSSAAGRLQMEPAMAHPAGSADIYLFYKMTDSNQNQSGVGAQKLNAAGELQWTSNGLDLVPLSYNTCWYLQAVPMTDGAVVAYFEDPSGDPINSLVKAIRVNEDGSQVWGDSPIGMSQTLSDKGYLQAAVNPYGQVVGVWQDGRGDSDGDIYLQNVNPDGSFGEMPISIKDDGTPVAKSYFLVRNYPNPFNEMTTIEFYLDKPGPVEVAIFDLGGRRIATLNHERQSAGMHRFTWTAEALASGIYYYRVSAEGFSETRKMVYLK